MSTGGWIFGIHNSFSFSLPNWKMQCVPTSKLYINWNKTCMAVLQERPLYSGRYEEHWIFYWAGPTGGLGGDSTCACALEDSATRVGVHEWVPVSAHWGV